MKGKGLLAAAVVLAILGGLLYWSNKQEKDKAGKPPTDTVKIYDFNPAEVQKIELQRKDGGSVTLERVKGSEWNITAPAAYRADIETATAVLTTVAMLSADKTVEDKATDLAQFGLAAPALTIVMTKKDGKTVRLLVGDDVVTGAGTFVKADGDPRVFTIASFTKAALDKKLADLRDKRLVAFENDKVTRVELTAKGQSVEFGKNAKGDWAIVKPKPMRADVLAVEELVRKLREARFDPTLPEEETKKAPAEFASGAVVGVAKVTDQSGTHQLEIRKKKETYYARGSSVDGIFKVSPELGTGLDKKPEDFRNKKVFDFGFNDVGKVEVVDGAKTSTFQKAGEKWMSGSQEMDAAGVQALIDKLRDAAALAYPETPFPATAVQVAVACSTGSEKVFIAKAGAKTLAKRDNEPMVYEVAADTLDEIQKAVAAVKPAAAPSKDAKKK